MYHDNKKDDLANIISIPKLCNINIWLYTAYVEGKVELFKLVDDFDKDRKDVRILVCDGSPTIREPASQMLHHDEQRALSATKGRTEHCALIQTIETLIERPNKKNHKHYYCNRCTYWFDSQIKCNNLTCSYSFKPQIVCPKKKHFTFINEHKRQEIKNIIADIECYVITITEHGETSAKSYTNKYHC